MADLKISALSAVTTPLAGTEVLPIVQAGVTKKVAASDLVVYPAAGIPNSTGTAWSTSYSTTGSGTAVVLSTSPTLVTPNLGTPSTLVGTNITGTAAGLSIGGSAATATSSTTSTNIAGGTVGAVPYQSAAGSTTFLNGNTSTTPQFVTSTGNGTVAQAPVLTTSTGTGSVVLATSPTLTTPNLGTPSALVVTNASGTASININGTVGATTANTGAFTTLTSTSTAQFGIGLANFFQLTGGAATNSVTLSSTGSDTNVGISYQTKGIGSHVFFTGSGGRQVDIGDTASAVNRLRLTGAAAGSPPNISVLGADANIDLRLIPLGTGNVVVQNNGLGINGSGGLGYFTGSGGAITQLTSRTTGVTLNKTNGAITLFAATGSITATTFTVTNSTVAATDVINVCQKSGTNLYVCVVTAVAAGSFNITFFTTGGVASDSPVINFSVIKAVTA